MGRAPQQVGAACAIALHASVVAALLAYEPARSSLAAAAPLMIELLSPPKMEARPERPPVAEPPTPRPTITPPPRPPLPTPIVAAPTKAPATIEVPPPPAARPPEPPPAPSMAAAAPAPIRFTPPAFNAAYLENPAPVYPVLSRRLGEEGRVVLRVLVNSAGAADEVLVESSSGHVRLDDAARTSVLRWRFVPAKRGEQAVAAWARVPIGFRLESN